MITSLIEKLERLKPFTNDEAWGLFRLAAIGEAIGWTLLISGILTKRYLTNGNNTPVLLAGQVHGILFFIYIAAVVVLYSSLRWTRKQTIIAGLASMPPYGSLVFEQWAAHKRRGEALQTYRRITVRLLAFSGNKLLAIQPKENAAWHVPGGAVELHETIEQALERLVLEQTGIRPKIGRLAYMVQSRTKKTEQLELYFKVTNEHAYTMTTLHKHLMKAKAVDELGFIKAEANQELLPAFLRDKTTLSLAKQTTGQTIIIAE
jgi:integral membrane protein